MPIQVKLPDGSIGEFPDGMSNESIQGVLQKQYPAPQQEQHPYMLESAGQSFMAGVDGLNRQFEKVAIAGLQLGNYVSKAMGSPDAEQFEQQLSNINKTGSGNGLILGEEGANKSYESNPTAYGTGAILGTIGVGLLGKANATRITGGNLINSLLPNSPILARTTSGILGGLGFGALQPADTLKEHAINAGIGGAVGGVLSNAIPAVVSTYKRLLSGGPNSDYSGELGKIFTPEKAALKNRAYQANTFYGQANGGAVPTDVGKLDKALEDFKTLGMTGTPGQVTGAPSIISAEKAMPLGDIGKNTAANYQAPELGKLQNSLIGTIKNMAPDDVQQFVQQTKPTLENIQISDDATKALLADPNIAKQIGSLPTNIAESQLPNNSVLKLNYIRQNIGQQLFNNKYATDPMNKLPQAVEDSLNNSYHNINNIIDDSLAGTNQAGLYSTYRAAAQKVAIQNNYMDLLRKIENPSASASASESNPLLNSISQVNKVHKVLFGNEDKITQFLQDVATVGGDVKTARAIINVSSKLSNTSLDKIMSKNPDVTQTFQGTSNLFNKFWDTIAHGGYNKALFNLTMSGDKWVEPIKKEMIRQSTAAGKISGFMKLINAASAINDNVVSPAISPVAGQIGSAIGGAVFSQDNNNNTVIPNNSPPNTTGIPVRALGISG